MVLVGTDINDEGEGVVVLHSSHASLSGQRVADNSELVHLVDLVNSLAVNNTMRKKEGNIKIKNQSKWKDIPQILIKLSVKD